MNGEEKTVIIKIGDIRMKTLRNGGEKMDKKRYVFISYSSKDIDFVDQLTDMMNDENIAYWKAPDMIGPGSNYAKEIPKAISECELFLLMLSSNSQESIWVEKELDSAICCRKKIIPLRIDDKDMNDLYKFYLNNVQMVQALVKEGVITNLRDILKRIDRVLKAEENDGLDSEKNKDITEVKMENAIKELKEGNDSSKHIGYRGEKLDKRSNAFRINRIPIECEYCGGAVELCSLGVYRCLDCGKENYDDFQKVRRYLEKVGTAPAVVISRNTGVPVKTIEHLWSNEFLEDSWKVNNGVICKSCGMSIRTGSLCDRCRGNLSDRNIENGKGAWHTNLWKK